MLRVLATHASVDLLSLVHDEDELRHVSVLSSAVSSITVARVPRVGNRLKGVFSLHGSKPLTHVLLDAPEVRPALKALRSSRPPDVVLAYCSGMAQYVFDPAISDLPTVVDMVDVDSAKWAAMAHATAPPKAWIYRREARLLSVFEQRAAMHARLTLVVNERERGLLEALAPSARIQTLWNGIDSEHFRPDQPPAANPIVVFCGVMSYGPNVDAARWIATKVWPHVRRARADAKLVIVGSSPAASVRALQSDAAGITVTGDVPDVRAYLWNAATAVAPIWIARGLQNKVLEAVAAGLPCVITPQVAAGLPSEVLPACPVANTHEQFAIEVLKILDAPAESRRSMAMRVPVTSLDWKSRLASLPELLREASSRRV
jgi:sugar transferase (PEP-CTERM/EpsH1 system associated)